MENIIGQWLLNSPEGRKIIKKSKNTEDLKNNVSEYIVKNDIIATPMGTVKDIKTIKDWEHIYKNTKFSYKDGGEVEKMKKGARLDTNWVGNKTKENWGKNNLYEMYSNNLDLCADLHDYFKQLLEDSDENYTNEMKNNLIEVLKTGNLKGRNGKENLKFAQGGATKEFNYSIGGL
jgi:hypothetical protein